MLRVFFNFRYNEIKALLNRDIVKNILIEIGYIVNKYYKFKIRPERTPSASIAPNGYIKDFGGDFNGDIFNFLVSNCNFNAKEALKYVVNFVNYDTTPKYDFKTNLNEVATILSLGYQENKIKVKKDLHYLKSLCIIIFEFSGKGGKVQWQRQ